MTAETDKDFIERMRDQRSPSPSAFDRLLELASRAVEKPAGADGDAEQCTDCGGTGVTYQTERSCSCQCSQSEAVPSPVTEADEILRELVDIRELIFTGAHAWLDRSHAAWNRARAYVSKGGV